METLITIILIMLAIILGFFIIGSVATFVLCLIMFIKMLKD